MSAAHLSDAPDRRKPVLDALTGLRAFAAGWVLMSHLYPVLSALLPTLTPVWYLMSPALLPLDTFFVLSGFIISYNYASQFDHGVERTRWARFLWARLARIYPVHLATLLALVAAVYGLGFGRDGQVSDDRLSIRGLVESLLLVQTWLGHVSVWNSVAWSLSGEWLAYLLFPFMSAVALTISRRLTRPAIWGAATVVSGLPALLVLIDRRFADLPMMFSVIVLSQFLAGCVLYRLFAAAGRPRFLAAYPGWTLVLLVIGAAWIAGSDAPVHAASPLIPPIVYGLAWSRGWLSRLFATRPMIYGGRISFSLYMTHYLWLWVMRMALPIDGLTGRSLPLRIGVAMLHVLPALIIGAATYHVIEEPARRAMSRLLRPGGSRERLADPMSGEDAPVWFPKAAYGSAVRTSSASPEPNGLASGNRHDRLDVSR